MERADDADNISACELFVFDRLRNLIDVSQYLLQDFPIIVPRSEKLLESGEALQEASLFPPLGPEVGERDAPPVGMVHGAREEACFLPVAHVGVYAFNDHDGPGFKIYSRGPPLVLIFV